MVYEKPAVHLSVPAIDAVQNSTMKSAPPFDNLELTTASAYEADER